jgi:hypothetical protein
LQDVGNDIERERGRALLQFRVEPIGAVSHPWPRGQDEGLPAVREQRWQALDEFQRNLDAEVPAVSVDTGFLPTLREEHERGVPGHDIEPPELIARGEDIPFFDPAVAKVIEPGVEGRESYGAWVDVDSYPFTPTASNRHEQDA